MQLIVPGRFKFKKGDATVPESAGHRLIIHIVNNEGKWGAGFVVALSKRWIKPEQEYKRWFRSRNKFVLGEIQSVNVQSDTTIINMLAQNGTGTDKIRVDYNALRACLMQVAEQAKLNGSSIHMPRIGCGLGGGSWDEIEPIIKDTLVNKGLNVTVYDLLNDET